MSYDDKFRAMEQRQTEARIRGLEGAIGLERIDTYKMQERIKELEKCGEHRQDIIEILEKRVEELEQRELGLQDTILRLSTEICERGHTIERLKAENQRLRAALKDNWCYEKSELRALLGGGE